MLKKIFFFILSFFKKEVRFACIIWDGKTMSYLDLTDDEIISMKKKNKDLEITKKEELLK